MKQVEFIRALDKDEDAPTTIKNNQSLHTRIGQQEEDEKVTTCANLTKIKETIVDVRREEGDDVKALGRPHRADADSDLQAFLRE